MTVNCGIHHTIINSDVCKAASVAVLFGVFLLIRIKFYCAFGLKAASIIGGAEESTVHIHHNNYHQYFSVILTKASARETKLPAMTKGLCLTVTATCGSSIFLNPPPPRGLCSYGRLLPLFHAHLSATVNIASDLRRLIFFF